MSNWFSNALKKTGHFLAKPVGFGERVGGTILGGMYGGIPGAMAGYKAGDSLANIEEDALSGRNVRTHLGENLLKGAGAVAAGYGASQMPNNGGWINYGRNGPSAGSSGDPFVGLGEGVGTGGDDNGGFSMDPNRDYSGEGGGSGGGGGWGGALDWAQNHKDLLGLGLSVAGGVAGGISNNQNKNADRALDKDQFNQTLAERQREFGRTMGDTEGQHALGAERSLNASPLRDNAMYLLQQRMGAAPSGFNPRDMFNPSNAPISQGGIDPSIMQRAAASYQPGMGGVKTDVEKALLARTGFSPSNPWASQGFAPQGQPGGAPALTGGKQKLPVGPTGAPPPSNVPSHEDELKKRAQPWWMQQQQQNQPFGGSF